MKWLIVEDALRDRRGHWLEYVSTFVRELRALGDEVVVLCDRGAQGFVMEQTEARPVLPESIWHRMGDGGGAVKRYLRVPGHAVATFFAMRKAFRGFSHGDTANTAMEAGQCLDKPSGAAFSNSSASELARNSENLSPTRSASDPSSSLGIGYSLPVTAPKALALDAGRWTLGSGEAPDWIFVPTVLVHHLLGWWMLLKSGSVPKDSRVLLFFPNLPIRLDDVGKPHWTSGPTTKLMAWLFAHMRGEVESGKVVLGVETHAMRRALEGLIRLPVVYLPHPVEAMQPPRTDSGGLRTEGKAETGNAGPGGIGFAFHGARKLKDNLTTNRTKLHERGRQGDAQGTCAGAAFSNSSTSKLARDCENTSLTRSADATVSSSPATSYSPPATSASPIVFGCYGAARWEKGSDIFQEAIRWILKNEVASGGCQMASVEDKDDPVTRDPLPATAAGRPLRFAIQWVEDFRDGEGNLVSIDPLLREHPQVEVLGRYFEGDEYERRLAQTDVMVLPYRSPYRLRVSRVVIEAMLNGIPVIATRGTTLFEQAEKYGVVVGCEEGDAMSLAKAMLEVAARFEMLRADAEEKVNTAAESFSVEYFRELLWRLCRRGLKSENG